MRYELIRSDRKTMAVEITEKGVLVRAPKRASRLQIELFLDEHADWIARKLAARQKRREEASEVAVLSDDELKTLSKRAAAYIPGRAAYYAPLAGVSYGRITIRAQKTRWGSCSAKGNLNFNRLLMLAPPEVIDSVVVHELCHRKEMNHSAAFYREVLRVFPEYHKWNRWLKENGHLLLARLPEK